MEYLSILIASLIVGVVIGVTGIGGGSLMTPALILLGVHPSAAVTNDLISAMFSKSLGAAVHWRKGNPHFGLVKWLALGSVPGAITGTFLVSAVGSVHKQDAFLKLAIGIALIIAATAYAFRAYLTEYKSLDKGREPHSTNPNPKPLPTVLVGLIGGLLVGVTSIGAGSVIMIALLLLYPGMKAVRLVSTDLVQAVPLVVAAGIGHVITSGIQWSIVIPLTIGSMTGTFIGSHLAYKVDQGIVRRALAVVLVISGSALLGLTPLVAVAVGVCALIIGRPLFRVPIHIKQRHLAPHS